MRCIVALDAHMQGHSKHRQPGRRKPAREEWFGDAFFRMKQQWTDMRRTVDRDGRPFTHPVHADLRMKTDNPVPWARIRERKEQNETEIMFPFVGLGLVEDAPEDHGPDHVLVGPDDSEEAVEA